MGAHVRRDCARPITRHPGEWNGEGRVRGLRGVSLAGSPAWGVIHPVRGSTDRIPRPGTMFVGLLAR